MNPILSKAIKVALTTCGASLLSACVTVHADGDPDQIITNSPERLSPGELINESDLSSAQTTQAPIQRTPPNAPPTSTSAGPFQNQPLIIDAEGLVDDDGVGQLTFQWQVQEATGRWVMADEGSSQSFTPRQKHVGKALRARIEYLDGQGTLETIITPATAPVQNVNDLPQGTLSLTGKPIQHQTLQIDASNISDEDGLGSFAYAWERSKDGNLWQRYTPTNADPSLLRLTQAHVGYSFRGRISYIDGFGAQESITTLSSGVIQNVDDPTIGSVTILGSLFKGSTLRVDNTQISDEDGIASIGITWQVSADRTNWQTATGVNNRELRLTSEHVGKVIRARAVVVDNFGNQTTLVSSATTAIENVNTAPRGVIRIITAE